MNLDFSYFYIKASGGRRVNDLGIFLYDEPVYYFNLHDNHKGIHDFRFKLKYSFELPFENKKYEEDIDFIYICNLEYFIVTETFQPGSKEHDIYDGEEGIPVTNQKFDYEKLLITAVPELFEYVKNRLKRKISLDIPKPVIYTADDWGQGSEFIQVDEFTTFAGNFEQNGAEGCCMDFGPVDEQLNPWFDWNIRTDWTSYDLPFEIQKQIGEDCSNIVYTWTKDQKKDFFNSLPLDVQRNLGILTAKRYIENESEPRYFPYRIYLYGTDDSSYSKWFVKEEDMMEDVKYLRKMQPISLERDVLEKGFVFTN